MQKEQRSSQPFMTVTKLVTSRSLGRGSRDQEAGASRSKTVRASGGAPSRTCSSSAGSSAMLSGPITTSRCGTRREQLLALLLRDAAGDGDHQVRAARLEARGADLAAQLLLGLLAHAAGVEDDQVGAAGSSAAS